MGNEPDDLKRERAEERTLLMLAFAIVMAVFGYAAVRLLTMA